ncbi:MAG: hypothetical protein FJX76_26710 [Armatimonadetes bacterium]|nr:hypothetical protein [Armatimonadota bacterium]
MWPIRFRGASTETAVPRLSARGRLTADVLELTQEREERATLSLQKVRGLLDEVLEQDVRFPFHLAAYLQERFGARRLAVALLVESANRAQQCGRLAERGTLPFSLRPLVARVIEGSSDAAWAMAYQVHHFGWSMPASLRVALSDVLEDRAAPASEAPEEPARPTGREARLPLRRLGLPIRAAVAAH